MKKKQRSYLATWKNGKTAIIRARSRDHALIEASRRSTWDLRSLVDLTGGPGYRWD